MSQCKGALVQEAYQKVVEERTRGAVRVGLWAKAWSMARGKHREAKARYLTLRVEMMLAEQTLHSSVADWRLKLSMARAA